jgi:carbonic anhydrase
MPRAALSRREFLRLSGAGLGALLLGGLLEGCGAPETAAPAPTVVIRPFKRPPIVPEAPTAAHSTAAAGAEHLPATAAGAGDALAELIEGNGRFAGGNPTHLGRDGGRRAALLQGQQPRAAILTCADSRVPPEILFDQGLGDLFVIRTAGNLAGEVALGSLEYAVAHLGVSLIVVLGHQHCGAVGAAVAAEEARGHIAQIVAALAPALEASRDLPGDPLLNAVNANVRLVVAQLARSAPILATAVTDRRVEVLGARYDLDTGLVEWLTDSPALQAYAAARGLPGAPAAPSAAYPAPETPAAPDGETAAASPTVGPAPLAEPPTPAVTPASDSGADLLGVHVVRTGETLFAIGLAYGVSPWEIARVNRLANPDRITPGQRLRIPNTPWRTAPRGVPARRQF